MRALVSIGVLQEENLGQEKLFVNPRLMRLLKAERHDWDGKAERG